MMSNHTTEELVQEAKASVPTITVQELKELQSSKAPHTLIDVRETDEWDKGHIEGAINIPRGLVEFKVGESVPDKASLVVVQCASGGRAALCGQQLKKMGYTNVKNLEGGYKAWAAETE